MDVPFTVELTRPPTTAKHITEGIDPVARSTRRRRFGQANHSTVRIWTLAWWERATLLLRGPVEGDDGRMAEGSWVSLTLDRLANERITRTRREGIAKAVEVSHGAVLVGRAVEPITVEARVAGHGCVELR